MLREAHPPLNGVNGVNDVLTSIQDSPKLREVLHLCLLGRYDDGSAMIAKGDAMTYRNGDAGVLAGALAAHFGEHLNPGWRAWLPAARTVLEINKGGEKR